MAAPIRFLSGRQQQQKIGIEGSTDNQKVLEVVGQVGIGTTVFEPSVQLEVRGDASVSGVLTAGSLNITGDGGVPASLTVETLNATGVSTFGGAVDVNAGLDVDGQSDLDELVVAGVATFSNAVDINSTLDVDGDTQLDDLNVAGVSTFSSVVNATAAVNATDIIKGYKYTAVPYGSTVTLAVTVASKDSTHRYNGTGSGNGYVIDGIQAPFLTLTPGRTYRFTNNNTGSHPLKFYLEADKTTLYETNVNFQDTYTEITVTDETPIVLHYQCTAHGYMGNAVQTNANVVNTNYPATIRSTLDVSGVSTFTQLDVSTGGLDVDGLTNLDEVVVAGVSTFTGNIVAVSAEFSGNVTIAGTLTAEDKTNIDSLGIVTARTGVRVDAGGLIVTAGVSTFTDSVDINNGVGVVGGLTADSLTISGVTTGINAAGISSFVRIDVDGQADLDELVVAGVATFQGAVNFDVNSEINIGTGVTILANNLHVTGIVSAAQFIGDGSGITNLPGISTVGSSSLTDVNVSGTTTTVQLRVSGVGTAEKFSVSTGGFDVDGQSDLDELVVAGVSTFSANTFINADLSVTGDIGASGIITATGIQLVAGSGLDVGAVGVLTALSVDVSTGGIDVDGQATLDEVVVAGVATFSALADVNNRLDVAGGANIDQLNVAGIASFTQLDVSTGGIDVDGQATLDEVVVSGASTFTGTVKIDGALDIGVAGVDVEGLTNLDELIVAGVSTFSSTINGNVTGNLTGTASNASGATGDFSIADKIVHTGDTNTAIRFPAADTFTVETGGSERVRVTSAGNVNFLGSLVNVNATGVSSFVQLDVSTGGLDVDGQTDLDELQVAGVSTFSAKAVFNTAYPSIDADNEIQVGTAIQLGKAGVITATSFSGSGANLTGIAATDHVSTFDLVVAGVSTFVGFATFRDGLHVTGVSTFANAEFNNVTTDFNLTVTGSAALNGPVTLGSDTSNSIHFGGRVDTGITPKEDDKYDLGSSSLKWKDLYLDGTANIDGLNVTGVSTFNDDVRILAGGLDVTGVVTATSFSGSGANLTGIGTQATNVQAQSLTVAGISTFNNDVIFNSSANIVFDKSADALEFADTAKAVFGDSDDLQIYHNSHSYIDHVGANNLHIRNQTADQDITIQTDDGSGNLATYFQAEGASGKASLHFYGAKKLATNTGGIDVTGGVNATGVITATSFAGDGSALTGIAATAHVSTFDLVVAGISTFNDDVRITAGGINAAGVVTATSFSGSGANLTSVDAATLDGVDSTSFLRSDAADIKTSGNLTFNDNIKARFGTSSDLEIYHNGTDSHISNTNGTLYIDQGVDDTELVLRCDNGSGGLTQYIQLNGGNGEVRLYHNTGGFDAKLSTKSSGIDVNGGVNATGVITATSFSGSGANLTGIGTQATNVQAQSLTVAGVSTFNDDVRITAGGINVSGVSTFSGIATHIDTLHGQTLKIAGVSTFHDAVTITKALNALNVNVLTTNPAINIQRDGTTKGSITPAYGEFRVQTSSSEDLALQVNSSGGTTGEIFLKSSSREILKASHNGGVAVSGIITATAINVVAGSGLDAGNTGVITATSFVGDGSALTGIAAGGSGEFNTGITSSRQIVPLSFESTVFTFPSTAGKQYVIESINVANVDESVGVGTTVNIIASIQDATAGEQTYIAYNVPIVTGGLIELLKNPIVAGPSDVIRMWSTNDAYVGVNNAADVYMNFTEHSDSTDFISKFASTASVTSTDTTTLYTSTSNPTVIEKIGLANRTDIGDFPISIKITNGTSTSYLAKDLIIPRYSTVDILDRQKRIETGAKIEVEVGSTSTIDIIIAGKKITS
jgi:hypothetical protein